MTASPAWTVRIAASKNSGSASLSTKPLAPARTDVIDMEMREIEREPATRPPDEPR